MHTQRRRLAAGLAFATLAVGAQAANFSQLVVFGDSLSDAGNAAAISQGNFPPSPLPYAGSFSNGPTAAQILAQRWGIGVELGWPAASATSNNFAVGGGRNGAGNYNVEIQIATNAPEPRLGTLFPTLAQTGIARQIDRYAAQHASGVPDAANALFVVWGGPNDVFLGAETGGDPAAYIPAALGDLQADVLQLAALGARHILVPGMPDLGRTPEALSSPNPAVPIGLSMLSAAYNGGIRSLVDGLGAALAPAGVRLYGFDTASFFAGVSANPGAFGFTNTTDSCLYSGAWSPADPSCTGFLYFDRVHPTTAAHSLLADAFAQAVPEPATYALMAGGLALLGAWTRRRAAR